jgi:peroxiredoxin
MSRLSFPLILGLIGVFPCAAEELPRYRLQVGQELIYSGQSEFKYQNGQYGNKDSWHIWVVKANSDGSWRLILRHGSSFKQGQNARPEEVSFAYCDLFPDGRLVTNDSLGFRMNPRTLLVALPKDGKEAGKGWSAKDERMDETYSYSMPGLEPGKKWVILVKRESPMNAIYGFSFVDSVNFDLQRGLPVSFFSEYAQTYGFNGKGKGTMQLDEVKTHDAQWCEQFAAEADRYFTAQENYSKAASKRNQSTAQMQASLEKAVAELKTVRSSLKMPELQKQVDDMLTKHDQLAKYYLEETKNRAAVLGQPAAEWDTMDITGKKHALKDYRGKVVILDFWYRGCGWCIRAMPQMKEIAAHFKDQPVVVFGMNTDPKEEDAKFVIDKMGLNYTTLKAIGVPEKYKVRGFPTLIIIDGEGVVRDIHVGYSPHLKEEVIKSVEKLLPKKS